MFSAITSPPPASLKTLVIQIGRYVYYVVIMYYFLQNPNWIRILPSTLNLWQAKRKQKLKSIKLNQLKV